MANEKTVRIMYVCTAENCAFSTREPTTYKSKGRKGKMREVTTTYGAMSAVVGQKAVCPVCGAVMTQEEDKRHKFLRVNSRRIKRIRKDMKLVGNTLKGTGYEPTIEDLARVRNAVYAPFDTVNGLLDAREEAIRNPSETSGRKRGTRPADTFAL